MLAAARICAREWGIGRGEACASARASREGAYGGVEVEMEVGLGERGRGIGWQFPRKRETVLVQAHRNVSASERGLTWPSVLRHTCAYTYLLLKKILRWCIFWPTASSLGFCARACAQGLTLVHFSAQPEPCLRTQTHTLSTRKTP